MAEKTENCAQAYHHLGRLEVCNIVTGEESGGPQRAGFSPVVITPPWRSVNPVISHSARAGDAETRQDYASVASATSVISGFAFGFAFDFVFLRVSVALW